MRNVSASPAGFGGRKSVLFLLFALATASIWPAFGNSTSLFADEKAAVPDADPAADPAAAPGDDAAEAAAPVQSRSFLAYIARACGWFWGPAFLLVSFILVALIMMNLLQVEFSLRLIYLTFKFNHSLEFIIHAN